jgi:transposase
MLHHGIDLHKRSLVIASLDASGSVVKRGSIRAHRGDVQRYFRSLSGPHSAVVECTGSWYWLADTLRALNVPLTLAHARQLKAIAAAKVKTDPVDAHTLAQLLRADLIPEAHMVSAELRPYRDLLRTRLRLVQKRVSAKNSISRVLEKYNVPSPDELPPLPFLQAGLFQDQVELLGQQIHQVEGLLGDHLFEDPDLQRLLRIPGIGRIGALSLILEIDDIQRFPSARHFVSYCRLVPGADNSGGRTCNRRSKEGNRYLKLTFAHAALRAVQYYPEIRTFYQNRVRSKGKPIARALVAKELARIVYFVLKRQVDYNQTIKGVPLSHSKQPIRPRRGTPDSLLEPPS